MSRGDHAELAAALRQWRERLTPADAGLPAGPRRRTPGLRREEVARLAGVSVDYVVRLEQARGPHPSESVLGALARALRLSAPETAHLFDLAGVERPGAGHVVDTVRPSVLRLLDRMADLPAMLVDARSTLLAWNPLVEALYGDLSAIPRDRRNMLWMRFGPAGGEGRSLVVDEDGTRERLDRLSVAQARAALGRYPGDTILRGIVDELLRTSSRSPSCGRCARSRTAASTARASTSPASAGSPSTATPSTSRATTSASSSTPPRRAPGTPNCSTSCAWWGCRPSDPGVGTPVRSNACSRLRGRGAAVVLVGGRPSARPGRSRGPALRAGAGGALRPRVPGAPHRGPGPAAGAGAGADEDDADDERRRRADEEPDASPASTLALNARNATSRRRDTPSRWPADRGPRPRAPTGPRRPGLPRPRPRRARRPSGA